MAPTSTFAKADSNHYCIYIYIYDVFLANYATACSMVALITRSNDLLFNWHIETGTEPDELKFRIAFCTGNSLHLNSRPMMHERKFAFKAEICTLECEIFAQLHPPRFVKKEVVARCTSVKYDMNSAVHAVSVDIRCNVRIF